MAGRIIREERRQRGVFGWIFLILFWAFNAYMLFALAKGIASVNDMAVADTEAGRVGQAIGTGIGVTMVLGIWLFGAIILGLFVLFTRGKTVIVEMAPAGVVAARDVDTSRWAPKDRDGYHKGLGRRDEPRLAAPRRVAPPAPGRGRAELPPPLQNGSAWDIELVGEQACQEAIADALSAARIHDDLYLIAVTLEPEAPAAVRVAFGGRTVGYLTGDDARAYRKGVGRPGSASGAIFTVDSGDYQVWLNLAWPPRFK